MFQTAATARSSLVIGLALAGYRFTRRKSRM